MDEVSQSSRKLSILGISMINKGDVKSVQVLKCTRLQIEIDGVCDLDWVVQSFEVIILVSGFFSWCTVLALKLRYSSSN